MIKVSITRLKLDDILFEIPLLRNFLAVLFMYVCMYVYGMVMSSIVVNSTFIVKRSHLIIDF
jgi:hypothetical protein